MSEGPDEALRRAREHLQRAALESVAAARALVDAAVRASGAEAAGRGSLADDLKSALDDWTRSLESDHSFRMPRNLVEPLSRALDAEIARWEKRSSSQEEARLVLRAFLGLRELLWELGMRPDDDGPREAHEQDDDPGHDAPDTAPPRKERPTRPERPRIQRFDIEH